MQFIYISYMEVVLCCIWVLFNRLERFLHLFYSLCYSLYDLRRDDDEKIFQLNNRRKDSRKLQASASDQFNHGTAHIFLLYIMEAFSSSFSFFFFGLMHINIFILGSTCYVWKKECSVIISNLTMPHMFGYKIII